MKLTYLTFSSILCFALSEASLVNSEAIDLRVIPVETTYPHSGSNTYYTLDVDADGIHDLSFYAHRIRYSNIQGGLYSYHLRLLVEDHTSVSCVNIPVGGPDEFEVAFSTFSESELIPTALDGEWFTWESGDLSFHGFEIAGGIPSNDSYLGVRIESSGAFRYGWVRLIFPSSYENYSETGLVKIKETAIETNASTEVMIGEGRIIPNEAYEANIQFIDNDQVEITAHGIAGMFCSLQVSTNLKDWDYIHHVAPSSDTVSRNLNKESSGRFYRWKISENGEN